MCIRDSVYIGLATDTGAEVKRLQLVGDREAVRHRAVINALMIGWRAAK